MTKLYARPLQADYRVTMAEYEKEHPKPPRRQKRARDPTELKRPQSAYFFFLADFRELYKVIPLQCISSRTPRS